SGINASCEGGTRRPTPTPAAGKQASRVFQTRNADATPARGTWCPGRPRGVDPVSGTGFGDTAGRAASVALWQRPARRRRSGAARRGARGGAAGAEGRWRRPPTTCGRGRRGCQRPPWQRGEAPAVRLDGSGLPHDQRRRYPCALDDALHGLDSARVTLAKALVRLGVTATSPGPRG